MMVPPQPMLFRDRGQQVRPQPDLLPRSRFGGRSIEAQPVVVVTGSTFGLSERYTLVTLHETDLSLVEPPTTV